MAGRHRRAGWDPDTDPVEIFTDPRPFASLGGPGTVSPRDHGNRSMTSVHTHDAPARDAITFGSEAHRKLGRGALGLDCVGQPSPGAIRAGGYQFICRYLSWVPNGKNLIAKQPPWNAELAGYLAAGIKVLVNWEYDGKPGSGFNQGRLDAIEAQRQLALMGIPEAPVMFSVDYDAPPAHFPAIDAYFDGCASILGRARTGSYGGYHVIRHLLDAGKIAWAWQCQAWSKGKIDPRIHLLQLNNRGYATVGGVQCDVNEAWQADYGAVPRVEIGNKRS